jgi:DNA-binding CsgD family transcriptional regulator
MTGTHDDAIVALWDELADFDAGDTAGARTHLMTALCGWLGTKNAGWVASMRAGLDTADPLQGWRIGATVYLHDEPLNAQAIAAMKASWSKREKDPLNDVTLDGAGERFNAFSLRAAMAPDWFASPYYEAFYASRGVHDAIYVLFTVNTDAVSSFVLLGDGARGAFTPEDVALAARVLRGLKWFHRRLMLGHGLLVASAPLTPAERRVLQELLSDASEKEIAERLGLAASTVHQYAVGLYRKFGVKGRTGLMSLWLNRAG